MNEHMLTILAQEWHAACDALARHKESLKAHLASDYAATEARMRAMVERYEEKVSELESKLPAVIRGHIVLGKSFADAVKLGSGTSVAVSTSGQSGGVTAAAVIVTG